MRSTIWLLLAAFALGGCGGDATKLTSDVDALKKRVATLEQRVKKVEARGGAAGSPGKGAKGGKAPKGKAPGKGGGAERGKAPAKGDKTKTKAPAEPAEPGGEL